LTPGRPVLVGFPQDEGVRRNGGRVGAAAAPREIRRWLYRLTAWDPTAGADLGNAGILDLGDLSVSADLEESQELLGEVVGAVLRAGAVPIVLGGGHETAYGHFLGYVRAGRPVGIINLDAHLDVRPLVEGRGHSGSPFRQALEHPAGLLKPEHYVCLGAQPFAVSAEHVRYVEDPGGSVGWRDEVAGGLTERLGWECERLREAGCGVYFSLDADVVTMADVPGVSAPNPAGLPGTEVLTGVRQAGADPGVSSFDLVEINPPQDRDGQSARWAAVAVWHFLAGLSRRAFVR
jgi:formiminoglutamase